MLTAQSANKAFLAIIVLIGVALVFPTSTGATSGNGPTCQPSSSCSIGEFLYNDSYSPITGASCSLTSYNPNGSIFLNNVSLTGTSNGWYSYTATTPSTIGLYPSQVCCDTGGQHLCIDKSFTVQAAGSTLSSTDVTNAVWNTSRSSYTGAGTFGEALQNIVPATSDIASAIWGYSTRSLSTFGTLAADIWNNTTRTLTGASLSSGNLAMQSDVTSVGTTVTNINNNVTNNSINNIENITQQSRLMLEQLVNKPMIQNFIEDGTTTNLQSKIEDTQKTVGKLSENSQYLYNQANLMASNWKSSDNSDLNAAISQLSSIVGSNSDSISKSTLYGEVNFLQNSWNWTVVDSLSFQTKAISTALSSIQESMVNGDSAKAYSQLKGLAGSINLLSSAIGNPSDTSKQTTLYGNLKTLQGRSLALAQQSEKIDSLLSKWPTLTSMALVSQISNLSKEVLALNQLPQIKSVLISDSSSDLSRKYKNELLAMGGVLKANQQLMVSKSAGMISTSWLEEGSIIFKSLITNPSKIISQTVPIEFYLPQEVKKENIIKTDGGINIEYDTSKNQYYASGEFTLGPGETRTISVEVDDAVFSYTDKQLQSWKDQAARLLEPLKNTSYYAQGVTLQAAINASCDRISNLEKSAVTPDEKVSNYRDAEIEGTSINTQLDALRGVNAQASSVGTLFGFVGGTQTLAVWGIILVIVAGFSFMAFYMRLLRPKDVINNLEEATKTVTKEISNKKSKDEELKEKSEILEAGKNFKLRSKSAIKFAVLFVSVGVLATSGILAMRDKFQSKPEQVLGEQITQSAVPDTSPQVTQTPLPEGSPKGVYVLVPAKEIVRVYSLPDSQSAVLADFSGSQKVFQIGETKEWIKIQEQIQKDGKFYTEGWVSKEFVSVAPIAEATGSSQLIDTTPQAHQDSPKKPETILIKDTPTGWLRVRETPGGREVGRVNPGESYLLADQNDSWFQIKLNDGSLGWISAQYAILVRSQTVTP